MKIVVTGGRDFKEWGFVFDTLNALHRERPITLLIEGGQRTLPPSSGLSSSRPDHDVKPIGGADYFAMRWAIVNNVPFATEPADWTQHGTRAGPIRNARMLNQYRPDLVVAFPGGKGTADCVRKARNMNITVKEFAPA